MPLVSFVWKGEAKNVFVEYYLAEKSFKYCGKKQELKLAKGSYGFETFMWFALEPPFNTLYYRYNVDGRWRTDSGIREGISPEGKWVNVIELQSDEEAVAVPNGLVTSEVTPVVVQSDILESARTAERLATDSTKDASYAYEKLDFDTYEIRLLRVNWASAEDQPISCSLEHVSLIDPPPYLALSYCWGDPSVKESIYMADSRIDIALNLHAALRAVRKLRGLKNNEGFMRIWVDSLCINQNDNEERSHQVRQMRQIYSRAKEVLCWVVDSQMPEISQEAKLDLAAYPFDLDDDGMLLGGTKMLDILDDFFSSPYWRRVWIIQEIIVASRATILYGDAAISWITVQRLLTSLSKSTIILKTQHAWRNALHLKRFREKWAAKRQIGILEAMTWSQHTLATDPRDKIFALLGLCHDGPRLVPLPNYKQPLETIIADMVWSIMNSDRSLDLMWLKGAAPSKGVSLPSWIPDIMSVWTRPGTIQESSFHSWSKTYNFNPIVEGSTRHVLKVRAKLMGSIQRIGFGMNTDGTIHQPITPRDPLVSLTSELSVTDLQLRDASKPDAAMRDQIWETFLMGLLGEEMTSDKLRRCFSTLWRPVGRGSIYNLALIAWIDQNAWFKVGQWTLREWSQISSAAERRGLGIGSFVLPSFSFIDTERLPDTEDFDAFITNLGRILESGMRLAAMNENEGYPSVAMVHPDAKEQDLIYFIRGCSIPVVLREDPSGGTRATVVGGAYIPEADEFSPNFNSKWADFGKDHDVEILDLY